METNEDHTSRSGAQPRSGVGSRRHRRPTRRPGISAYLVVAFGSAMLVLVAVVGTTGVASYHRQRQDAVTNLQASAAVEAQAVGNSLTSTLGFLQSTVNGPEIASLDPSRCQTFIASLAGLVSSSSTIAILRPDGTAVCASKPDLTTSGRYRALSAWIGTTLAANRPVIQTGGESLLGGPPSLLVGAPVRGVNGQQAILVATMPFTTLVPGPSSSFPRDAVFLVLSADRSSILTRVPGASRFNGTPTAGTALGRALPTGMATLRDVDGQARIYRQAIVPSTGWNLLVGMTPGTAFASAAADATRNLALAGLTIALLVALVILLHGRLARPVRNLRMAIEAASTDNSARAAVEGPAEIAAVAEAFNATIAERRALEGQLAHQALHDPLTDLPNRALLADRLAQAVARQGRDGGLVAVAFMDLDRFKLVNDSHGHPAGDQMLVALGRRLLTAVRPADTVARFGGDEFVMLAEGLKDTEEACAIASRLTAALELPFDLNGEEIYLSGSVGVALAHGGQDEPHELIRNADAAMYRAKEHNRGSFAIYDERMHEGVVSRLETERDLHRAVADDELVVHYQPKCSLATGEVAGVEALVRWNHPTRGLVNPADFIPIAEETGLILPVGEWVLTEACRRTTVWRERYGIPLTVSVNLSALQLARADLPEVVADVLRSTGADPGDLWLEVTEGSLLGDAVAAARRLGAIRDLGVRVSLDDFGTGYSSLAYLRTLPLDEVKIDRSFITDVAHDPNAAAIVASIVRLGHALGLVVVAEGVETAGQLATLRELGCDLAQGFYLSHPLTEQNLTAAVLRGGGLMPMPVDDSVA